MIPNITAQEKAEQLFQSMKGFRVKYSHTKKCVKLAIKEVLDVVEDNELRQYYEEVLKETEKLN